MTGNLDWRSVDDDVPWLCLSLSTKRGLTSLHCNWRYRLDFIGHVCFTGHPMDIFENK